MWNEPNDEELSKIPPLYTNESMSLQDIIIHMHFFLGGSDWYVAEYSPVEQIFFGYAILNDDLPNSEWGYTSYHELRQVKMWPGIEVDRDLYWKVRRAGGIERIVEGMSSNQ